MTASIPKVGEHFQRRGGNGALFDVFRVDRVDDAAAVAYGVRWLKVLCHSDRSTEAIGLAELAGQYSRVELQLVAHQISLIDSPFEADE